jgi:hypothetical protein
MGGDVENVVVSITGLVAGDEGVVLVDKHITIYDFQGASIEPADCLSNVSCGIVGLKANDICLIIG